jgi:diacylglycerol kinase (ATP)
MPTEWSVLILVAAVLIIAAALWWGLRTLQRRHVRPAVAEPAHTVHIDRHKVAFILNPITNNAELAEQLVRQACAEAGWEPPLVLQTTPEDPGHAAVRQALSAGCDLVVAGGGDGTIRVVAGELANTNIAMGLVPLGTGNLLARNLDLDVNDLAGCIRTALFGHQRRIDTAAITIDNSVSGIRRHDSFLVIAGVGMDAEVVADTRETLKQNVGWIAYGEAGIRHIPGRRKKLTITLDDGPPQTRKVRSVLFANCGLLPGGIDFIPDAVLDDGTLDIVVMSPRSALGWLWMAGKVLVKHRGEIPMMDYYRARKIRISTPIPTETQLDGDPSGAATSITVQVQPAALLIRVKDDGGGTFA